MNMNLKHKNCKKCNKELTEKNWIKTKNLNTLHLTGPIRMHCFDCVYIKKQRLCIWCKSPLVFEIHNSKSTCSDLCLFYNNIEIINGCHIYKQKNLMIVTDDKRIISVVNFIYNKIHKINMTKKDYIQRSCKNKKCVKIDHLIMVKRTLVQAKKLNPEKILEIKDIYENRNWTLEEIAQKFNVSNSLISRIVLEKTWNCIKSKSIEIINNYLKCKQCQKEHDLIGAEFCSQECLLKYMDIS